MNYKRRVPRRKVKCWMCTDFRYGNSKKNLPIEKLRFFDKIRQEGVMI